jgi:hypothetical protein
MAVTPVWALVLRKRVCEAYGIEEPPLQFWNSSKPWTTGRTKWRATFGVLKTQQIVVTYGGDGHAHDVLLHELAHHIDTVKHQSRDSHGTRFWRLAFDLYEKYGSVDVEQFVLREFGYRQGAAQEALRRPRWRQAAVLWMQ